MADDSSHEQPTMTAAAASVETSAPAPEAATTTTGTSSLVDDIAAAAATLPVSSAVTATASAAPTNGTATPIELDPEQAAISLKVSLADLTAKGNSLYQQKNYEEAAEIFSHAAEMQAEMNSDMSPDNAEILFLYGRALFRVGQANSDVLGGAAPATGADAAGGAGAPARKAQKKQKAGNKKVAAASSANDAMNVDAGESSSAAVAPAASADAGEGSSAAADLVAEGAAKIAEDVVKGAEEETTNAKEAPKKPLFQFSGDENFYESEKEEDENDGAEEEEEEQDDLETAYEVLDLARVLFEKKLDLLQNEPEENGEKGKEVEEGDRPALRHVKERLGDTHDILGEISLEGERFPTAIGDMRQALKYKNQLFPEESEIIAEAHYKLSLALEFASQTTSKEDAKDGAAGTIDQGLRDEAAAEMKAAIDSMKLKLRNQEVELATIHAPEDNEATRARITEVKVLIQDMEQRWEDLKKPPVDVNTALGNVLGASLGGMSSASLEQANQSANDITSMVRKNKKTKVESPAAPQEETEQTNGHEETNGKRKAEDEPEDAREESESKKAKVETAAEAAAAEAS